MEDYTDRMGKFSVSDGFTRTCPVQLLAMMHQIVVIRCEFVWPRGCFEYVAVSPLFDKIAEGESAPGYIAELIPSIESADKFTVIWHRQK